MQGNVSAKVLAQAAQLAGGDMANAKRWYFECPLPEFDGHTPAAVVAGGREADLVLLLDMYDRLSGINGRASVGNHEFTFEQRHAAPRERGTQEAKMGERVKVLRRGRNGLDAAYVWLYGARHTSEWLAGQRE